MAKRLTTIAAFAGAASLLFTSCSGNNGMRHRLVLTLAIFVFAGTSAGAALRVNHQQHLYVALASSNHAVVGEVAVFRLSARGNVAPEYVIFGSDTKLDVPTAVTFDARGDLYVYDAGGYTGGCDRVVEFAPGARQNARPIRVIEGNATGFCNTIIYNIAVTPRGAVYVGDALGDRILVFGAHQRGNAVPEKVLTYINPVGEIDFDGRGDLFNAAYSTLDEYSPSGEHLGQAQYPGNVYIFAIAHETIYVPAEHQNVVTLTSLHNLKTRYTFSYPRSIYWSATVDADGYMYFFYTPPRHKGLPPLIEIYAPGGSSPIGSIDGPLTGFSPYSYGSARVGP